MDQRAELDNLNQIERGISSDIEEVQIKIDNEIDQQKSTKRWL